MCPTPVNRSISKRCVRERSSPNSRPTNSRGSGSSRCSAPKRCAGFKVAYEAQNYKSIVDIAAKLPDNVLQEHEKLLMYFDVANTRLGDE